MKKPAEVPLTSTTYTKQRTEKRQDKNEKSSVLNLDLKMQFNLYFQNIRPSPINPLLSIFKTPPYWLNRKIGVRGIFNF